MENQTPVLDIIKTKIKELPSSIEKEAKLLDAIGFSEDEYYHIQDMVDDVIDQMLLIYKKNSRQPRKKKSKMYAAKIILEALIKPEGKKYLAYLDDHVYTLSMKMYLISILFVEFERRLAPALYSATPEPPPPNAEY